MSTVRESVPYSQMHAELARQVGGELFRINFEGLIRDIYVSLLKPGDWALDIGANEGVHTVQMAQAVAPAGRVIAVEAVPVMADGIKASIATHHPHLRDVIDLRTCGMSNAEGRATFYFAPELTGCSGLRMRDIIASREVQPIDVELTTVDRICAGVAGSIRFMKIDIEGAEYDALRGAQFTILRHQPVITFEHNPTSPRDFGYSMEHMVSLWASLGYRVYDLFGNPYTSVAQFTDSLVWDYLAAPVAFVGLPELFNVVRETLARDGIQIPA